jgi:hypothetical protein
MRSTKLIWALTALAATAALAPATALALRRPSAGAAQAGRCRLHMNVAPRFVQAGEATAVFGQLVCPPSAANPLPAAQAVTVFADSAGGPPSGAIATATTDEHGNFAVTTPALQSNSVLYATADGVRSVRRPVKVSAKVTLAGPADGSQLFTGGGPFVRSHLRRRGLSNKVVFSGSVSPADAGAVVALQRESSVGVEEWRGIAWSTVGQGGTYSIVHTFAVPGDANIRVVVHARHRNAAGASEPLSYEISQAQNPALTIESSADPVSFGQPVTIGGKLQAATPTALTLLARTRLQHGFATVATTTSDAAGAYSFPVQTPTQSVFYKVVGGGRTSSRLFEGVRYGVSATASAESVAAGQPVTFAGTVTPAHELHPVYLQALSGSGVGYHTVGVATVGADGRFTIAHAFYTAGVRKLRVKVPGDPENQGAATAPVVLQVTPAPAATLAPEAPGNSAPPFEGRS